MISDGGLHRGAIGNSLDTREACSLHFKAVLAILGASVIFFAFAQGQGSGGQLFIDFSLIITSTDSLRPLSLCIMASVL